MGICRGVFPSDLFRFSYDIETLAGLNQEPLDWINETGEIWFRPIGKLCSSGCLFWLLRSVGWHQSQT